MNILTKKYFTNKLNLFKFNIIFCNYMKIINKYNK